MMGLMEIWPSPGSTGERLQQVLDYLHQEAVNFAAGVHDAAGRVSAYIQWGTNAQRMAYGVLSTSDLERLVLTRRYWAVVGNPNPSAETSGAISDEMTARKNDLEVARRTIASLLQSWQPRPGLAPGVLLVVDTNVLMKRAHRADDFDWHGLVGQHVRTMTPLTVVVPMAVVDELDGLKRGTGEVRTNARHALKFLSGHLGDDPAHARLLRQASSDRGAVSLRLLLDPQLHQRLPIMDDEIIDRAASLATLLSRAAVFVTYDTGAAFRAKAAGLSVQLLSDDD